MLLIGAVLANFIGTTGASMLLIRPLLQTNSERKHTIHVPIFFIFLVSNIGGCLTPLGDPPLFMGLIKGVPFFWTLRLFPLWAVMVGGVLLIFYLYDGFQYRKEECRDIIRDRQRVVPLHMTGTINFLWLAGVVAAIFLPFPSREGVLILMAILSLLTTKRVCRIDNKFTYNPILEVAILFAGIFVTMIPALLILNARGAELGITKPWQFFWATGSLSSFLDNTPTYLAFFSMAQGLGLNGDMMGIPSLMLKAISAGAVFMGANSYIGNGPNFMVKVIAEEYKLKMPSFFGYMAYSCAILIPLYRGRHPYLLQVDITRTPAMNSPFVLPLYPRAASGASSRRRCAGRPSRSAETDTTNGGPGEPFYKKKWSKPRKYLTIG